MKKNLVILFLALLTIINIAALATFTYHRFHPKGPFHPMDRPDKPESFVRRELDLNEKQAKEFEAHFKKFRMEMEPIMDSLRAKRAELTEEMSAEKPSAAKLDKLTEEIGALDVRLQKKTIMHMLEGKAFLTPEQQKKFFSLFKEGQERMKGWRDRGDRREKGSEPPDFEEGR
jgi:Spy/CpxP family protein refolding chaperone